jgi:1-acyl-sn-glycerol-3-phosphate acyltransferase
VLVGLSLRRRLNFLARETLFGFAPFRWLILSLDAIPIDREGVGLSGLKETLRRLKRGEMVLIFPEGTRSRDGEVGSLKPGFVSLARRGNVRLLPVGIDGAFEAWPRTNPFPRSATINIQFGAPMEPNEVKPLNDEELIAEIERRIRCCHAQARASKHHRLKSRNAKESLPI